MDAHLNKAEFRLTWYHIGKIYETIILLDIPRSELSLQRIEYVSLGARIPVKVNDQKALLDDPCKVVSSQGIDLRPKNRRRLRKLCRIEDFEREQNLNESDEYAVGYFDEPFARYYLSADGLVAPFRGEMKYIHYPEKRSAVEKLYCYVWGHFINEHGELHKFGPMKGTYFAGVCPILW